MCSRIRFAAIVALFIPVSAINAQNIKDYDRLFTGHDTLEVEIQGPLWALAKERSDVDEVDAIFRYTAQDGNLVEFDIALRARGNLRRNPAICNFPPLRINFKKSQTKDTLFDKQDKLKLVTHCKYGSQDYIQDVISEYLAYRMFNQLTDYSFAVRLVKIRYVYEDKNRTVDSYGILLEHDNRLAKRIDASVPDADKTTISSLRREDLNLVSVFQYFIGNTDFSPRSSFPGEGCCHNQALFVPADGLRYTIPYDFDQAGLVNAQHAKPNPRFGFRSVRTRLYRGRCINNDLLPDTLEKFRAHHADFEALLDNQSELTKTTRGNMRKYINGFYKIIDDPRAVDKHLLTKCI